NVTESGRVFFRFAGSCPWIGNSAAGCKLRSLGSPLPTPAPAVWIMRRWPSCHCGLLCVLFAVRGTWALPKRSTRAMTYFIVVAARLGRWSPSWLIAWAILGLVRAHASHPAAFHVVEVWITRLIDRGLPDVRANSFGRTVA